MSVNTLGEHVAQYWLSAQEVCVLLRAVEEMLEQYPKRQMSEETLARLRRLSAMLSTDE